MGTQRRCISRSSSNVSNGAARAGLDWTVQLLDWSVLGLLPAAHASCRSARASGPTNLRAYDLDRRAGLFVEPRWGDDVLLSRGRA